MEQDRKARVRGIFIPLMVFCLGVGAYSRMIGDREVRAVDELMMFALGMLFAVVLMNLRRHLRSKQGK